MNAKAFNEHLIFYISDDTQWGLNRYLLDRLCSCLFLCRSYKTLEEAFFLLGSSFGLAVQSLDIQYIDTADNSFYFLFHRNAFEDLLVTDQGYDLRTNLCLDDGELGTTHHLRVSDRSPSGEDRHL